MFDDLTTHAKILACIAAEDPRCCTRGFKKALRFLESEDPFKDVRAVFDDLHIVPDGYVIDHDLAVVCCHEVEVSNGLSDAKILEYINLFWALDSIAWELWLIAHDRWGNARNIDILSAWHTFVRIRARDRLGTAGAIMGAL